MPWPPKILLALLAALTGCSREPTFRDVQKGKVSLDPGQRQAIEALLEQAKLSARKLSLGSQPGSSLLVENGEAVVLRFSGRLTDPRPLAALPSLRELHLWSARFSTLEGFGEHPNLRKLSLSQASSIGSLEGLNPHPLVSQLSLEGPLRSVAPLAAFKNLETLYLHDLEVESFESLPVLPRLRLLSLGPAKVRDLSGLASAQALEEIIFTDLSHLESLEGFPSLPALRRLEIHRGRLQSLAGLPSLPSLVELEIQSSPLQTLEGLTEDPPSATLPEPSGGLAKNPEAKGAPGAAYRFPKLETLKLSKNRLQGTLRLPSLQSLREVHLSDNEITSLDLPPEPSLESIDLSQNRLVDLGGLGPQPALASVSLSENPVSDLQPLLRLPALRSVDIHDTGVGEIPKEFYERSISLRMDRAQVEANRWERALRDSWKEEGFIERLPGGRGRIEGRKVSCSWAASTFRTPRLSCQISAATLEGILYLPLVTVNPLSPTAGGPNKIPLRATLEVEEGVARVYLRERIDFRATAEALASYTDRSKPMVSIGDPRDPGDYREGYRFAEARPGQPAIVSGEAGIFVDQIIIWLQGVDGIARGVSLTLEPR